MQRVLTVMLVAAFAVGPALNLRCPLSCVSHDRATVSAESCHDGPGPEQTLSAGSECTDRVQTVALAAKRTTDISVSFVSVVAVKSFGQQTDGLPESNPGSASAAAPPLLSIPIPLRI